MSKTYSKLIKKRLKVLLLTGSDRCCRRFAPVILMADILDN
jgi:hypothetical protein